MPSPWCMQGNQHPFREPERHRRAAGKPIKLPCEAKTHTGQNVHANPKPASLAMFLVQQLHHGRPQAARCAFMRLISPGFRLRRTILRS